MEIAAVLGITSLAGYLLSNKKENYDKTPSPELVRVYNEDTRNTPCQIGGIHECDVEFRETEETFAKTFQQVKDERPSKVVEALHGYNTPFVTKVTQPVLEKNTRRMQALTGTDEYYKRGKRNVEEIHSFQPTPGFFNGVTSPVNRTNDEEDRICTSQYKNEMAPIEPQRVGPGLNLTAEDQSRPKHLAHCDPVRIMPFIDNTRINQLPNRMTAPASGNFVSTSMREEFKLKPKVINNAGRTGTTKFIVPKVKAEENFSNLKTTKRSQTPGYTFGNKQAPVPSGVRERGEFSFSDSTLRGEVLNKKPHAEKFDFDPKTYFVDHVDSNRGNENPVLGGYKATSSGHVTNPTFSNDGTNGRGVILKETHRQSTGENKITAPPSMAVGSYKKEQYKINSKRQHSGYTAPGLQDNGRRDHNETIHKHRHQTDSEIYDRAGSAAFTKGQRNIGPGILKQKRSITEEQTPRAHMKTFIQTSPFQPEVRPMRS